MTQQISRMAIAAILSIAAYGTVRAAEPETVMITLHPKAGAEQALADVIARHYETVRRLDMLHDGAVHVTLRGADEGDRPYFVEILTWRDGSVPDTAPKAVLAIWNEMQALVEARGGRSGLDIVPVHAVTREK
jgi:hypothetical protein